MFVNQLLDVLKIANAGVNFLDDKVRSITISILLLIGATAPILKWMTTLATISDNHAILFLYYALVATIGYFSLIPMALGNGIIWSMAKLEIKIYIIISIFSCLGAGWYAIKLLNLIENIDGVFFQHKATLYDTWVLFFISIVSVASCFIAAILYTIMFVKYCFFYDYKTYAEYKQKVLASIFDYLPQFHQLSGITLDNNENNRKKIDFFDTSESNSNYNKNYHDSNTGKDINEDNNISMNERELKKGIFYMIYQFLWPTIDFDDILQNNPNFIFNFKIDDINIDHHITSSSGYHHDRNSLNSTDTSSSSHLTSNLTSELNNGHGIISKKRKIIINKMSQVIYPARLFAGVYIALMFVLIIFYTNHHIYHALNEYSNSISRDYAQYTLYLSSSSISSSLSNETSVSVSSMTSDDDTNINSDSNSNSTLLVATSSFDSFLKSLTFGMRIGMWIGFICGIYSCLITFRAWKKKVIYLRLGLPTYRLNSNNKSSFGVWWTTRFMATLSVYIATGSLIISYVFALLFAVLISNAFKMFVIDNYQYLLGYGIYWAIDYIGLRYILFGKILSDSNNKMSLKSNRKYIFNIMIVLSDFLFIPLAFTNGIAKFGCIIFVTIGSFLRPDINMYPRGFESIDNGYLTYIASVRITVERERRFIEKNDSTSRDSDAF